MKYRNFGECCLWILSALILYLAFVGARPLNNPDEGRYVEIPREMVASGDWITPHLNGVPYFYKPPLLYWLEACAISVCGLNWIALRFFPALFGAIGVGAVFWGAARLFGRSAGRWSACCLATTILWGALSQVVILDVVLSASIAVAMVLFIVAAERGRDGKDGSQENSARPWPIGMAVVFYAALSAAVMTKGLVGMLIPAAVVGLWIILTGRWIEIRKMRPILGMAVVLLLTAPWHIAVSLANPPLETGLPLLSREVEGRGFFWFYFVHEHFLRYSGNVSGRPAPFWFFFVILPVGFFPWVALLPSAVADCCRSGWHYLRGIGSARLYLLLWTVFVLVFFSISKSKLVPYILPAMPPLAILTGEWLARMLAEGRSLRLPLRLFQVGALILAAGFAIAAWAVPEKFTPESIRAIIAIMVCGVVAAAVIQYAIRRGWPVSRCLGVAAGMGAVLIAGFNPLATAMQRPSTLAAAEFVNERIPPQIEVFVFYDYYQDFPVYLQRTVGVIAHRPTEQQPGLSYGDFSSRYPDGEGLRQLFSDDARPAVCLLRTEHLPIINYLLEDRTRVQVFADDNFLLVANAPAAEVLQNTRTD